MSAALPVLIPTICILLAIVASHISLRREIVATHRDMEALRDGMARLEGITEAILKASAGHRSAEATSVFPLP